MFNMVQKNNWLLKELSYKYIFNDKKINAFLVRVSRPKDINFLMTAFRWLPYAFDSLTYYLLKVNFHT